MVKWEYKRIGILYDEKTKGWVYSEGEKETIRGYEEILNHFGSEGWEAINITPTFYNTGTNFISAGIWAVVFKRPKENA